MYELRKKEEGEDGLNILLYATRRLQTIDWPTPLNLPRHLAAASPASGNVPTDIIHHSFPSILCIWHPPPLTDHPMAVLHSQLGPLRKMTLP